MKIAFVAPFFGVRAAGGAEQAARSLAGHLAADGLQIEVLTTCLQDLTSGLDQPVHPEGLSHEDDIPVRRFPVPRTDMRNFATLNGLILGGGTLSYAEELQFMTRHVTSPPLLQWIADHQNDYDWFCFIPYLFGTTCFGVPLAGNKSITIPCFHDEGYTRLQLVQRMVNHTRRFVFNAAAEQRFARERFDIPAERCHTVGLGMATDIEGNADRFRHDTGISDPFLLYVGRRDTTKNVHTLIRYFLTYKQRHPGPLKLALVGPAPLPMAGSHPEILDLGFVPSQQKYDAIRAAAVLCQPSLHESFSYVIMEAWLCHTPCLVHADCAVTHDHVLAANGGLAFRSQPEFDVMLSRLLEDQPLAAALAEQGRAYVLANYAWPRIVKRFREEVFAH